MASKYDIPDRRSSGRGFDWQRISRWSFLAAVIMLLWLLYPTARCSWWGFKDIPLSETDSESLEARDADRERIEEGGNFVSRWLIAVQVCYAWYPPTQQEPWKKRLFLLFASISLITWALGRLWLRNRRVNR